MAEIGPLQRNLCVHQNPFSPENIAGLHFPAFLADGCGLIVEMNCVTSQLKWPRAGVYLPFFLSLTMRTEDLHGGRGKYTQVFVTRIIYTDSTHKNSHVDSDVSVLKVSRAMNSKYLYLKPPSSLQFQCHTNMGPKECS